MHVLSALGANTPIDALRYRQRPATAPARPLVTNLKLFRQRLFDENLVREELERANR